VYIFPFHCSRWCSVVTRGGVARTSHSIYHFFTREREREREREQTSIRILNLSDFIAVPTGLGSSGSSA
jgi:hypothetical protein